MTRSGFLLICFACRFNGALVVGMAALLKEEGIKEKTD
jgi:hypothetical protein